MDLNRRNSAGELSVLAGSAALSHDRGVRIHQLRKVAKQVVEQLPTDIRNLLQAYTDGVNKGLHELGNRPFEYWMLSKKPQPWMPEDSFLAVCSMYPDLSNTQATMDQAKGFLASIRGKQVVEFLIPVVTRWDAPLEPDTTGDFQIPAIPDTDFINLRALKPKEFTSLGGELRPETLLRSNNFTVAGRLSRHGGAIVEDDMHLSLRVPTTWYRMQLIYT